MALAKLDHTLWGEIGRKLNVSLPNEADKIAWGKLVDVVGAVVRPAGYDFTIETDQGRLYVMSKGTMAENLKVHVDTFIILDQQRLQPMTIDNLLRLLIRKLPRSLSAVLKS